MVEAIEEVGFLMSIPLWVVSMLGALLIIVLSFVLILTVYGRFFRLYMYTALSPLPLASFAGEGLPASARRSSKLCRTCAWRGRSLSLPASFTPRSFPAAPRRLDTSCPL